MQGLHLEVVFFLLRDAGGLQFLLFQIPIINIFSFKLEKSDFQLVIAFVYLKMTPVNSVIYIKLELYNNIKYYFLHLNINPNPLFLTPDTRPWVHTRTKFSSLTTCSRGGFRAGTRGVNMSYPRRPQRRLRFNLSNYPARKGLITAAAVVFTQLVTRTCAVVICQTWISKKKKH